MPNPLWDYDPLTIDATRSMIRGAIEDATGRALSLQDASPDTLIAQAQALGIPPAHLQAWIHSHPRESRPEDWSAEALQRWASTPGPAAAAPSRSESGPGAQAQCFVCGEMPDNPETHQCQ